MSSCLQSGLCWDRVPHLSSARHGGLSVIALSTHNTQLADPACDPQAHATRGGEAGACTSAPSDSTPPRQLASHGWHVYLSGEDTKHFILLVLC